MKIIKITFLAVLFLSACSPIEYHADIPSAPPQLGVYCIFSPDSVWKTVVFRIGNLTDYEYNNQNLQISDAQVLLYSNGELQEQLLSTGEGVYTSAAGNKPVAGNIYRLEIHKENYPSIITDTASVPPKIVIDSIMLYNNIQAEYNSFLSSYGVESGNQLDLFFQNPDNLPITAKNTGILMSVFYKDVFFEDISVYSHIYDTPDKELNFFRCNNDQNCYIPNNFNELQISFGSSAFFDFYETADIQDYARNSFFSYFPGNIKSNVENGQGLFAGINYLHINLDTINPQ
jgi:hypothetical protein